MNALKRLTRFRLAPICFIIGLCFFLVWASRSLGYLEALELTAYDWFIRSRPALFPDPARILVIEISEKDILTLGQWPLTDHTLAKAIENLLLHHPRSVGLDIFRDIRVPPGSEELETLLRSTPDIICVTKFGDGGVPPPPAMKGSNQVGFNDMLVDPGGISRRGLLFLDDGNQVFYAFNLLLALHYLREEGISAQPDPAHPEYLKLGPSTLTPLEPSDGGYVNADARGYQYLIDFRDAPDAFPSFPLIRLLTGDIPPEKIRDKIVLIGVVSQSVKDHFYTPFSRGFESKQQMPGVVLHAHLVSQLIRLGMGESSPMRTPSENWEMLLILVWSILGGVAGFSARSLWRFPLLLATGGGGTGIMAYGLFLQGWWIPFVPPILAWLLCSGMATAYVSTREKQQRALLMQLFSKHVSREIADAVWAQRDEFLLDGRPRPRKMTTTILFSDIRGFTTISEALGPEALIDWLNTYMEVMTETIMAHGGVIDDYAGDGIKANFGVPFPRSMEVEIKEDAVHAVECALDMGRQMDALNAQWQVQGLPLAGTRIGIYTGDVVAGALGSSKRMKYTTVGDSVNTAARLESYDKQLAGNSPCRVLIGETTFQYLNGQFHTLKIGVADLKGKNRKITIFQVLPGNTKTI